MNYQLICRRILTCGFRVPIDYFVLKRRFSPGICPNCGGPLLLVHAFTDVEEPNWKMDRDPNSRTAGTVTVGGPTDTF